MWRRKRDVGVQEGTEGRDTQNSSSRGSGEVRVGGGDVEMQEGDVETQEGDVGMQEGTEGRDTQNSLSRRSGEVRVRLGGGDVEMQEDVEAMEGRDTQNSSSRGSGEARVGGGDVEMQERDVGMQEGTEGRDTKQFVERVRGSTSRRRRCGYARGRCGDAGRYGRKRHKAVRREGQGKYEYF